MIRSWSADPFMLTGRGSSPTDVLNSCRIASPKPALVAGRRKPHKSYGSNGSSTAPDTSDLLDDRARHAARARERCSTRMDRAQQRPAGVVDEGNSVEAEPDRSRVARGDQASPRTRKLADPRAGQPAGECDGRCGGPFLERDPQHRLDRQDARFCSASVARVGTTDVRRPLTRRNRYTRAPPPGRRSFKRSKP